ncbi:MAG: FAD-dependent oxidoreductase [Rhodobacteraceae bacterium]|nr:FAD-dependent oxidoreductase [Paracoccaceae bacterium]
MHVAVIGRGLIGSAAARHLARAGHEVTLIGPDEPEALETHRGVFGSHYDEGRITRGIDPYPFWSRVSRASIARYGEIETDSGIRFYTERGILMAGPEGGEPIRNVGRVAEASGIPCEQLGDAALASRFPWFHFPEGTLGYHETKDSGFISPRALVQAQGIAAEKAGARIVAATATGFHETGGGVEVETDGGTITADELLIAAGGFTNGLLDEALPLSVLARTVALFELDGAEVARLKGMPPLIYLYPSGEDPYLLPPILYPDGRWYLKLGGDRVDLRLETEQDRRDWFRSGGSAEVGEMLTAQIRDRIPGLAIRSIHVKPCVTTYTPSNHPIIDRLGPRVSVAVGGCGRGAKCSDELGRLGAEAALGRCDPDLALGAVGS